MAFDLSGLSGFERRETEDGGGRTDRSMRTSEMVAVVDSLDRPGRRPGRLVRAAFDRWGESPIQTYAGMFSSDTPATAATAARDGAAGPRRPGRPRPRVGLRRGAPARPSVREPGRGGRLGPGDYDRQRADRFRVEIYKKNSIALACLVFVLVGVPLGLAVPRAGVGLVAALAVFVFLFYWISLVGGEKLADREMLPAEVGMWAANVIIGVLGTYLVVREARDPAWRDPVRALAGRFKRRE